MRLTAPLTRVAFRLVYRGRRLRVEIGAGTASYELVEGEPLEIYAFVGSSRLEEPLNRYPVTLAFHGHAHRGQPHGTTASSVPVYNVSMPLLTRTFPDKPPFRLMTLPVDTPGVA